MASSFIESIKRRISCDCEGLPCLTEYGSYVCPFCGVENLNFIWVDKYTPSAPLHQNTYTRLKRFRKYLCRAAMHQSAVSIPDATWKYLFEGAPYTGPPAIVRRLKRARGMGLKKCYDCLPLLTKVLCPQIDVPVLSEHDRARGLLEFRKLEKAYREGEAFVSYLFVLEYILVLIGRRDILPYINKIQCLKRRRAYTLRLNRIYR